MRSAMASAVKPMSMSSDTWLCLRSWTRIGSRPAALLPRAISWLRKCFVTGKIRSSGSRSSAERNASISSA